MFAGAFHFAFGAMQLFMGIGIDLHGVRRTVLVAFPLTIAGSLLSALTTDYALLVLGQVLIGVGCAPAFLVCTVFIARHFPAARFASVSGLVLGHRRPRHAADRHAAGVADAGQLVARRFRGARRLLGRCVAGDLVAGPRTRAPRHRRAAESVLGAVRSFGALFALPHTLGILALAVVTYAAFISLRGLWLGPLLIERHGFSLVQSGNVALIVSIASMFGPPLFGRLDPGTRTRRRWILGCTAVSAALFALLAVNPGAAFDVGGSIAFGRAVGLHRAAVRRRARRVPGGADRPRDGGLHDGDVPRRRADAVADRRRRVARRRPRHRPVHRGAGDDRGAAGRRRPGVRAVAGAVARR